MRIPPVPPGYFPPPSPDSGLIKALQSFLDQYTQLSVAWDNDPSAQNLDRLEECMRQVRQFLEQNQTAILQQAKFNGWPDPRHKPETNCLAFIEGAVRSIDNFLGHPNKASLEMGESQLTQLQWLLTSRR